MKFLLALVFVFIALPGFAQEDDEKLLKELERDRKTQTESAVQLDQGRQEIIEKTYNIAEELQKIGHDSLSAAALMDERVVEIVQKGLKQNHLNEMDHKEIKEFLRERAQGGVAERVFNLFPRTLNIAAGIMGDKDALPALLGMLRRQEDLKRYAIITVCLFVIGFVLKKFFIKKKWGVIKRFFYSACISLSMMVISTRYFYYLFKYELTPTIRVVQKHW